ncbi:MAG: DMT family transporter [Candidatus Puniceispirillaceae bacterium]
MTGQNIPDIQTKPQTPEQNVPLGAFFLFSEIVISMGLAGLVKQISGDVSFFVIMFFRYLLSLPLLFLLGWHQRKRDLLQVGQIKTLIARIVVGMLGLSTWFNAVIYLPISLATVLAQTMTIFITILAPLMLAETVGPRRIAAVLFGFVGVVVLVNPMADSPVLAVAPVGLFFGLAAPFFAALMFIYLRKLGTSEAPISTTLWYNLAGTLVFFILALADGLPMPDISAENQFIWFVLIFTGLASSAQQFLMAKSHQLASATVLAPVHYSAVPVSVVIGILFFNEVITLTFIAGTTVIIGSTWYIFQREQIRKAEQNS